MVERLTPSGPLSPDDPLSKLGAAVGDAIDKIAEDGTGGESPLFDRGQGQGDPVGDAIEKKRRKRAEEKEQAGDDEAEDEDEQDEEEEEEADQDEEDGSKSKESPKDDSGKESHSSEGKESETPSDDPAKSQAVADEAAKVKGILEALPESVLNGYKKFISGGDLSKITTLAELKTVADKFGDDYWRTNKRLAGKDPDAAPETKPGDEQKTKEEKAAPEVPAELRRIDDRLQQLQQEGKEAVSQRKGWKGEVTRLEAEQAALLRTRGTEKYDEEKLADITQQLLNARDAHDSWDAEFNRLKNLNEEVKGRRHELSIILDTKARLDRAEREGQESETARRTHAYTEKVEAAFKAEVAEIVKTHKGLTPEFLERLKSSVGLEIHRMALHGEAPTLDEVPAVVSRVVGDYIKPIKEATEAAKRETMEQYTKDKAADAPKVPDPKNRRVKRKPGDGRARRVGSLEDLQGQVFDNQAWDNE